MDQLDTETGARRTRRTHFLFRQVKETKKQTINDGGLSRDASPTGERGYFESFPFW